MEATFYGSNVIRNSGCRKFKTAPYLHKKVQRAFLNSKATFLKAKINRNCCALLPSDKTLAAMLSNCLDNRGGTYASCGASGK